MRTQLLGSAVVLSGTFQDLDLDLSHLGSLGVSQRNKVIYHFVRASGTDITFQLAELFSYKTANVEQIDWTTVVKNAAGTLSADEYTTTVGAFSFPVTTYADNIRLKVKGSGTFAIYATVEEACV